MAAMSNGSRHKSSCRAQRFGILGGTFDPIHNGHLSIARAAKDRLDLARVFFVPARVPPHKRSGPRAGPEDRLAMVRLALAQHDDFCLSDVEIGRTGVSYSIDTVRAFQKELGEDARLFFIIGADTTPELPSWKDIRELARLCTFAAVTRPGRRLDALDQLSGIVDDEAIARMKANLVETEGLDVSSTEIRRRVRSGKPIDALVPEAVARHIVARGLYR